MRTLRDASASWQDLKQYNTFAALKEAVRLDGGHTSPAAAAGLRSASWKAFLLFDDIDTTTWPKTLASARSAYDSLRMHFFRHLDDGLETGRDPLSVDPDSQALINQDEALRAEIQQDVDRCMPDNLYFRQPETQRMLLDILFVFSKLNPDVSYRQGMHELLAPILWVVERDAIDLGQSSKAHGEDVLVRAVFDAEYIEHDAFALFSQVMHSAKNFYEQTTHQGSDNPMVLRSQRIFADLLAQVDPELAHHLDSIEILPQVFLMRWIRLLFGREFAFDEMLTVWDLIFAEDTSLEIVDYVCLAMLLRIRWELLDADYNAALTLLLRYPGLDRDHPAQSFALDALYLRTHLDTDGSGYLVLKYTGRALQARRGAVTPPALQRNITTFSGIPNAGSQRPSASRASSGRPPRNFEAMLQSTARNLYARGEKIGVGLRSAVDEVHKRAQEIRDIQTPSVPPRARSGSGNFYARVKALEERNRQLGALLDSAVAQLWEYQKEMAAENDAQQKTGDEEEGNYLEKDAKSERLERLSLAIARVQFVQVYLEDSSLPLPESEGKAKQAAHGAEPAEKNAGLGTSSPPAVWGDGAEKSDIAAALTPTPDVAPDQSYRSHQHVDDELADPSTFDFEDEEVESAPQRSAQKLAKVSAPTTQPRPTDAVPSQQLSSDLANDEELTVAASANVQPGGTPPSRRPPLAESPYSWMLEQDPGRKIDKPELRSPTPRAHRHRPQRSRGFLFGDTEGWEGDGGNDPLAD